MGLFDNDYIHGGPRYGFHATWIVGAVIILFGLVRYALHTQVNPVTGERQHLSMTAEQEKALGLQAAPRMAAQMGGEATPPATPPPARWRRSGSSWPPAPTPPAAPTPATSTTTCSTTPGRSTPSPCRAGRSSSPARCWTGWTTRRSWPACSATRPATSSAGHSAQQMEKGQLGQTIATGVAVGGSGDRNGYAAAAAAQMANQMLQLHYSRDDESQADEFGMKYMAQAGYDPRRDAGRDERAEEAGSRQPRRHAGNAPHAPAGHDPHRARAGPAEAATTTATAARSASPNGAALRNGVPVSGWGGTTGGRAGRAGRAGPPETAGAGRGSRRGEAGAFFYQPSRRAERRRDPFLHAGFGAKGDRPALP